jgi:hypothetical protein
MANGGRASKGWRMGKSACRHCRQNQTGSGKMID